MLLGGVHAERGIAFWDVQRRGGNQFNKVPREGWWDGAKEAGLGWVRLVPDKWKGKQRDFLIGDCDGYRGLVEADFAVLKGQLDLAEKRGIRVMVGMLSLPGARWVQLNGGKEDYRLWREEKFHGEAAAFWRDLAGRLKGHPAVAGYNILNEPHPEKMDGIDGAEDEKFGAWREKTRGSAADLDKFYATVVGAIREVDGETPILVEGYGYGSAAGLARLAPVKAAGVLYSLHFYEPWQYTASRANKGRYAYPTSMPDSWDAPGRVWTREDLGKRLGVAEAWAKKNGIPANRIVVGEFGVERTVPGAAEYLRDVIAEANSRGWHWAFYAFREDVWDAMDYELGTGPTPQGYYYRVEQGKEQTGRKQDGELWRVIGPAVRGGK